MVVFGLPFIDSYTRGFMVVELEADWVRHGFELADLILRKSRDSYVHVVMYSGKEFIDVDELYHSIEQFIRGVGNVAFSWASSIESFVYYLSLLPETSSGTVFIILPYPRDMPSTPLVSKLHMLRQAMVSATERGWEIVVINPMENRVDRGNEVFIANNTLKLVFDEKTGEVRVLRYRVPVYKTLILPRAKYF